MYETLWLLLVCLGLRLSCSECQTSDGAEGFRLVNGSHGDHMGRVEVLYNGTWGTVCSIDWSYYDARAACRSVGYVGAVCALRDSTVFGPGEESAPVWMSRVGCLADDNTLDNCTFSGWGENTCLHDRDAAALCYDPNVVGTVTGVSQIRSTATTATIVWKASPPPIGATSLRFHIQVWSRRLSGDILTENLTQTDFEFTLTGLSPNTSYSLGVRPDVRYLDVCRSYFAGPYSRPLSITTNDIFKPSILQVRLLSPIPGLDFMGRLEVRYNSTWGTVCDDYFAYNEARLVCRMADYSDALCHVREAGMGQGTGPIWLDNVDCRAGHDVLEDCDHNGWGVNNCQHNADIGLICRPNNDSYYTPVANIRAVGVSPTSISLQWDPFVFPAGVSTAIYRVRYRLFKQPSWDVVDFSGAELIGTLTELVPDRTYLINVRAVYSFSFCPNNFLQGVNSNHVTVATMEAAPSGPPTAFYVRVLNSSAIEAEWELPLASQRDGVIRGYLLFVQPLNGGSELQYNITGGDGTQLIVGGLTADKGYTCSVLAYTVAEGPRSVYLTVVTYAEDFVSLIGYFGENGDGYDRSTHFLNETSVSVHCGSGLSDVELHWLFPDGSQVGTSNRNIYEGRHDNGTTTLYITNQPRLSYCDAGTYVCVASGNGNVQERDFTLMIGLAPPPPSAPYPLQSGSTWLIIGWDEPECDGGHKVTAFNILYREQDDNLVTSNRRIYHIDPALRNYTLRNLQPETQYNVSLQALSAQFHTSPYTFGRIVTTLPEAPTPPRDVMVRLTSTSVVEVSWRAPAVPNGIITQYTVYGTSRSLYSQDGVVSLPQSIQQSVAGHIGTVNITIPGHLTAVVYEFQVSAAITVGGQLNEGTSSTVTPESTVLLPNPLNTAVPRNVIAIHVTNTSVTLQWDFPLGPFLRITEFQVGYTGSVEWISRGGHLYKFAESGGVSTGNTRLTVSPLVPETTYRFRVSAVTAKGPGREIVVMATTGHPFREHTDKIAYFQLRILQITDCFDWQENSAGKLPAIKSAVLAQLNAMCSCALTPTHVTDEVLSCRAEAVHQTVYRGRILGSDSYSATGLVSLLQSWVQGGAAALTIDAARLQLDTTCDATLDNGDSPACPPPLPVASSTPPSPSGCLTQTVTVYNTVLASPDSVASESTPQSGLLSGGEIGGLIIGVIVALLLLVFIALLLVVLVKAGAARKQKTGSMHFKELVEEEVVASPNERSHDNAAFDLASTSKPDHADF